MATFPVGPTAIPDPKLDPGVEPTVAETLKSHAHLLRHIVTATAAYLAQVQREQENSKERDARNTEVQEGYPSLYAQEGPVSLRTANQPTAGDVLYAIDGKHAAWGSGTSPAPTDPGTGPSVGSPHALLDGVQNNDTVAQTPSRGSLIYGNSTPKWDELVKPASPSVLKNDATDALWATIPTRKLWLDPSAWTVASSSSPSYVMHGTYPDNYVAWDFDQLNTEGIETNLEVPEDWLSGLLTFKVRWATSGATATNWVPIIRYIERNDGDTLTAANTLITGPTTSANVAVDVLQTTTIGTFTPTATNRLVRLVFERAPGGSDSFLGTIRFLGLRVEYQPLY